MMTRYVKKDNLLCPYERTFSKWIVVLNGEEFTFNTKKLALFTASVIKTNEKKVQVFKETTIRFYKPGEYRNDKKFRIDITNQIP